MDAMVASFIVLATVVFGSNPSWTASDVSTPTTGSPWRWRNTTTTTLPAKPSRRTTSGSTDRKDVSSAGHDDPNSYQRDENTYTDVGPIISLVMLVVIPASFLLYCYHKGKLKRLADADVESHGCVRIDSATYLDSEWPDVPEVLHVRPMQSNDDIPPSYETAIEPDDPPPSYDDATTMPRPGGGQQLELSVSYRNGDVSFLSSPPDQSPSVYTDSNGHRTTGTTMRSAGLDRDNIHASGSS